MAPRQSSAAADRFSTFATMAGVVLGLLYLATVYQESSKNLVPGLIARLVPALGFVAGGLAVGWIGSRVGMLLWRIHDLSRQLSAAANDHIADMRQIADRLEALVPPPADDQPIDVPPDARPEPAPEPAAPAAAAPAPARPGVAGGSVSGERVIALLEEIREAALLDDDQRRARLQQLVDARRRARLDQVCLCSRAGQWANADGILTALEGEFGGDALVRQARGEFHRLRDAAEPDALFHTEQRVRDLVQASGWERAIDLANGFINNYPASADGRRLLAEVYREHDVHRDTTFHRLYEQVQANVDRRQWRAALDEARRLLEQFPTHDRANRIRQQVQTIAANAEIEERQEHEVRLQLLVKNQRFAEAVDLAEDVIRRFPKSPQADALEARLPHLRELAELGDGDGI